MLLAFLSALRTAFSVTGQPSRWWWYSTAASAISSAAALDPSAEGRLVERATTSHDLADVRERADKVKAAARHGEDPAVRRARLRALRRWREFDRDGMREVMGRFVPEEWARVAPVIDAYLEAQFQQARREGRREPIEAYRADAVLAALAAAGEAVGVTPAPKPTTATETAALPAESTDTDADAEPVEADSELERLLQTRPERVKWNLCLMVDAIALQRGYPTATETCEIVGFGPVSIELARQILPDALVDVLVHDLVDIKAHATMTRHQKRALKAALKVRDRRCVHQRPQQVLEPDDLFPTAAREALRGDDGATGVRRQEVEFQPLLASTKRRRRS